MLCGKIAHTFPVESYLERWVQGMNGAVPIGFLMALSQDMEAMKRFRALSSQEKDALLQRARQARSREEMDSIIRGM